MLRFSLPFLFSMVLQSLYGLVDMIVVGQYCKTDVTGGVVAAMQITLLVTNMIGGFVQGGSVLISQYRGAKRDKDEEQCIGTLFSFFTLAGLALTGIMLLLTGPLVDLVVQNFASRAPATHYLYVTLGGTVFIVGYNTVSAVLRGLGDSVRPLIFVAIATVVNIVLDIVFIAGFGWGAAGAAWATVIAQALSLLFAILSLRKMSFPFQFRRNEFKIARDKLKTMLKIGLPSSLQNTLVGLSFTALMIIINHMDKSSALNGAIVGFGGRINNFAILPNLAIGISVSAMVGQNIGAGRIDRAKQTMAVGIKLCLGMAAVIVLVVNLFPEPILRAFSSDPDVVRGVPYLRITTIDYILTSFIFCLNGLFIGAGHTTFALVGALCGSWLFRVPLAYFCAQWFGLSGIAMGMVGAGAGQLLICLLFYKSNRWQKRVIRDIEPVGEPA